MWNYFHKRYCTWPQLEHLKEIAKKLASLEASQRATARMLGVNVSTVNRDVANATIDDITSIDIEVVASDNVANATPSPPPALLPDWMDESGQSIPRKRRAPGGTR